MRRLSVLNAPPVGRRRLVRVAGRGQSGGAAGSCRLGTCTRAGPRDRQLIAVGLAPAAATPET
eukprot:5523300-Prymnesium_polylepis.1